MSRAGKRAQAGTGHPTRAAEGSLDVRWRSIRCSGCATARHPLLKQLARTARAARCAVRAQQQTFVECCHRCLRFCGVGDGDRTIDASALRTTGGDRFPEHLASGRNLSGRSRNQAFKRLRAPGIRHPTGWCPWSRACWIDRWTGCSSAARGARRGCRWCCWDEVRATPYAAAATAARARSAAGTGIGSGRRAGRSRPGCRRGSRRAGR